MDDWDAEVDDADVAEAIERARRRPRAPPAPRRSPTLARRLEAADEPGARRRPRHRRERRLGAAIALAERQNLPVFAIPPTGGGRIGFPEGHPNFRGILPPGDRARSPRRSPATT